MSFRNGGLTFPTNGVRGPGRDNRPAKEIVDSDWTMMNDTLALHYGYRGIEGGQLTLATGRSGERPVESWETREDAPDA